ncbi:MMPL family transporter [Streptomyces sp. XM4193]|uniref:MMPL family transporter n=1 Tax=Streptomyces sp. XM4193 TaxID=2929782 RepID=UPI001FF760B8|nr:MMPL family transporter [Streptomyces sp. XM4193]MCK1796817.1 MMPL family transporter [Streptomyces sp. XM4193]
MATFLYKLGRLAFRRRRIVALLWVVLLIGAGAGASTVSSTVDDDFALPGTESQQAFDLMDERAEANGEKSSAQNASATVVFKSPDGEKLTDSEHRATIEKVVGQLKGGQIAMAVSPFQVEGTISQDQTIAYAKVNYTTDAMSIEESDREKLKAAVEDGRDAGLKVEMNGDATMVEPDMGNGEIIGIGVAAIVLVLTFGSLVAAGLPLITALIGVITSIMAIGALGPALGLSTTTATLAMMIGLAVGIDYALFIASRYRAELIEGHSREEAAGRAVGTAGSAVVFAGLTVVIALAGLAVVNIPLLTKMGMAAAGAVVVAVLVAITLVPAALGIVGKRIFGKKVRKANPETLVPSAEEENAKQGAGVRWARFTLRRPVIVLVTSVLALAAAALPVSSLSLGLPDDGNQPESTTQRQAYDLMADGFGAGFNGPLAVIADVKGSDDPKATAEQVYKAVSGVDGIKMAAPPELNKGGDLATIAVIPDSRPSSTETEDLVLSLRDEAKTLEEKTGATVLVSGMTAATIDFSKVMDDALVPYLTLVVGLAFLLLMMVFRSILVPLKAALGFLLSVLAALGAVVAVFQWGWLAGLIGVEQTGPIMSLMPIFMIGVIFGLAMDYEVFLVTRMREAYVHGERASEAVVTGFKLGGRVVTAAAVIMISVFAGFIGAGEPMIKMMGFGLAIAILFDAFVVRMAIVPAVLALLGDKAWWLPKWLDRIMPNVDVEGEKLQQFLDSRKGFGGGTDGPGGFGGGDGGNGPGDGGPQAGGPGGSTAAVPTGAGV